MIASSQEKYHSIPASLALYTSTIVQVYIVQTQTHTEVFEPEIATG